MWVAVDKDGEEWIYEKMPIKHTSSGYWVCVSVVDCIKVPKGTIQRLLNYPLTWDDEAEEIVKYKDNNILKKDKMIKQNIKMRVTPKQSRKVQEICFENGIVWEMGGNRVRHEEQNYLFINDKYITFGETYEYFEEHDVKEIDADLFIRTNGTCEEESTLNDDDITRILKASEDQPREYLKQKIVNLHDQLNKYRKTVQNQKEELTRLLNQKKQLNNRLDIYALCNDNQKIKITNLLAQKEELQHKLNGVTNLVEISIQNDDLWAKELKEKDAIIKYLENKLEI